MNTYVVGDLAIRGQESRATLGFCTAGGEMDVKSKDNAGTAPEGFMP